MNREQRRHPQQPTPGPQVYNIPPVNIQYAHNDECVVMLFSEKTGGVALRPEHVDDMIAKLEDVKQRLLVHQKMLKSANA